MNSIWDSYQNNKSTMPASKISIHYCSVQFNSRLWKWQRWIMIIVPKSRLCAGRWRHKTQVAIQWSHMIKVIKNISAIKNKQTKKTYKQWFYWKSMNLNLDLWKVNKVEKPFCFPGKKTFIISGMREKEYHYRPYRH